ncbi:MAG: hypothetical protein NC089_08600 [Bacteroides sp.]|nr:hypothetical protein [Bacteroides sp.]MCM1550916.1 hypothetical protein [Clostridium sp.]
MGTKIEQSIQLSKEGIENMKFQFQAYKKGKAGEALTEAEQGVVDRIAKGEEAYREYGLNIAEEGASMSISKLGLDKAKYVGEFHEISNPYTESIMQRDYETASGMDVLKEMNNRYQSLREKIETRYRGDKQAEKVSELDEAFQTVLNDNILKPLDLMMKKEQSINEVRMRFLESYEKTLQTKGEKAAIREYGDLSGWKEPAAENVSLLEKYQTMSEQLKNLFGNFNGLSFEQKQAAELLYNMTSTAQSVKANNLVSAETLI